MIINKINGFLFLVCSLFFSLFFSLATTANHTNSFPDPNYGKNKVVNVAMTGYSGLAGYKAFVAVNKDPAGFAAIYYYHNLDHLDANAVPDLRLSESDTGNPYFQFGRWPVDDLVEGKTINLFIYQSKTILQITGEKFDPKIGGTIHLDFVSNFITNSKERIALYSKYNPASDSYTAYYNNRYFKQIDVRILTVLGIPTRVDGLSFDGKKVYGYYIQ